MHHHTAIISDDSSQDEPNETLCADLGASSSRMPQRPLPNSARKRRHIPDLSRRIPSPSHEVKMSMIFRDSTLRNITTPSLQLSSNTKRSRLPFTQAKTTKFGFTHHQNIKSLPRLLETPSKSGSQPELSFRAAMTTSGSMQCPATETDHTLSSYAGLPPADETIHDTLADGTTISPVAIDHTFHNPLPHTPLLGPKQLDEQNQEPISSGVAISATGEVLYPKLADLKSPQAASTVSGSFLASDDVHSSHGVHLIMPSCHRDAEIAQRTNIDSWLEGLLRAAADEPKIATQPKATDDQDVITEEFSSSPLAVQSKALSRSTSPQNLPNTSGASGNKEKVSPSKSSSSPTRPPRCLVRTTPPFRFHPSKIQSPNHQYLPKDAATPSQFPNPTTPLGHLSLPPKRKRTHLIDQLAKTHVASAPKPAPTDCNFTIHEDQLAGALATLSPRVECHRKGRRPKRERCASYWDTDILTPGSTCSPMLDSNETGGPLLRNGKRILGVSKESAASAEEQPFIREAEDAAFGFSQQAGEKSGHELWGFGDE